VILLIVVILIAVGVHSCQVSQRNSALRDYSDNVAALIRRSNQTGQQFFQVLSSAQGSNNAPSLQTQVNEAHLNAQRELSDARNLSVPDQVKDAQTFLKIAFQLRSDGIADVAQQLQPALQPSTASTAVNRIATDMAYFYSSDVLYKGYALPKIVNALHGAGIAVGGSSGEPVEGAQFLPDIQWLTPSYIATRLHVTLPVPTKTGKAAPGVHGHALDSCSVGNITLQVGTPTTVPATPTPTLTCQVTNDGANTETNVAVKATVEGTSVTGQGIIPQTQPNQQYTVQIPLSASPPKGQYNVNVGVQHVPGETTFTHNSKVFPVAFQ
jgi:Flp pilus assembly protein TadG